MSYDMFTTEEMDEIISAANRRRQYHVINDEEHKEPAAIKIMDEEGNLLVKLNGPMSMTAAGAFIQAMEDKKCGLINVAIRHFEQKERD